MTDDVDVLVVGGGPAGLSAATWLGRYRRRTLLVDAGAPRNAAVSHVHGVLGWDPTTPGAFRAAAVEGLARYPDVAVEHGVVSSLGRRDDRFVAEVTRVGHASTDAPGLLTEVVARRVVLATGVRDRAPDVIGFDTHYGAGVQHCPTCEGFEARDLPVVVIGWGEHVPGFATELLDWAASVTIVSDGPTTEIDDGQRARLGEVGIEVVDDRAEELIGPRGDLRGVRLTGGRELPAGMAFFSIGHDPSVSLALGLGCELTPDGVIAVDDRQLTTTSGVYAAGDVTPGMQLVSVAAGEGTIAGVSAASSLHGGSSVGDAPTPAPEPDAVATGTMP
jgi:thioredoxin reductase